jgi:solute carrier family 35 protein E2
MISHQCAGNAWLEVLLNYVGCTLFLNKYIMSYLDGDSTLLATCQMLMTMVCGYLQMSYTCRLTHKPGRSNMPTGFYK